MAGLKHFKLAADPAIIRLNSINSNRYKYFRWTPRTALITFNYIVAVPLILGVAAYSTEGKWNFRAKRKGDLASEY
ncbi:NADH:ubiquinone oxidoreductase 6.6kD subunit [Cryphonectria parasitica EP155]|uniref:NADH dehydrogenase [ubiquinone] 1 beta subcomplex subunit 4 n=1 Tax=Cryphonectria parasitica (strain ATCC 38755 / EP155) TaxID=660469 RepID=A0A9P4YB37_CRYP1|nr:NADH:ubiquinone oxidoreductase 6.6kD subunit [Cryphonectria parasitica EP155]KAF3770086.1 NADH:ubiquinone oxidoreductase 6.6kD subunit [Cryphonectria parasitica EP155]